MRTNKWYDLLPMKLNSIKSTSLVDQVCAVLAQEARSECTSGDGWLPPEREMASKLGVSRTVLREATKRLELQGLLEIQHGVGIRAVDHLHKPLSGSLSLLLPDHVVRLEQLMEARLTIEPEIARLAGLRASAEQIEALSDALRAMAQADSQEAAVVADIDFHRQLAQASGNEVLALMLESLSELGRESRRLTIGNVGKERAIEHHAAILKAVAEKQPDAAAQAMRTHVQVAIEDLKLQVRNGQ